MPKRTRQLTGGVGYSRCDFSSGGQVVPHWRAAMSGGSDRRNTPLQLRRGVQEHAGAGPRPRPMGRVRVRRRRRPAQPRGSGRTHLVLVRWTRRAAVDAELFEAGGQRWRQPSRASGRSSPGRRWWRRRDVEPATSWRRNASLDARPARPRAWPACASQHASVARIGGRISGISASSGAPGHDAGGAPCFRRGRSRKPSYSRRWKADVGPRR